MEPTWDELILNPTGVDIDELLSEWRWLVDERYSPVAITAFGDLFLRASDDSIHRLDAGLGDFSRVAQSLYDFKRKASRPEHREDWFHPQLLSELHREGMTLGPSQCYGYKIPPILGGTHEAGNFEPTSLAVHHGILGQIVRQVKALPPGTPISQVDIEGPSE